MIPFNKPYLIGRELDYIKHAVELGKLSGNGQYTQKCQALIEKTFDFKKSLLTTSCTDALEMAAILSEIKPGEEVILPSFTFVSTALAFARQGAKLVFADSSSDHPNINAECIEELITPMTRLIVPVHYAGVSCDMGKIMEVSDKYRLMVIEDAAQAIDSKYMDKQLGSIGSFGCFSFHETKNIIAGEAGLLTINDASYNNRSEIIWEKGTNRAEFFRGEVNKYGWVDIGSSFLPSEIIAAFLFAQLENITNIQNKRKKIWSLYLANLRALEEDDIIKLPVLPEYATNNAHMFYLVCRSLEERSNLISFLRQNGIMAVFHYQSLHNSPFYNDKHDGRPLPNSDMFSDCLVRLPLFYELTEDNVNRISELIHRFYRTNG